MFFEKLKRSAAAACLVSAFALAATTTPMMSGEALALPAGPGTSGAFSGVGDNVELVQNRNRRRAYRQGRRHGRRAERRRLRSRYHGGRQYYWDNGGWWYYGSGGAAVAAAAGIAGLLAGAALAAPRGRTVILEDNYVGGAQPYSAAWYQQCGLKYRSFRSSDGTFLGYDGVRRVCTLP